MEDLLAKVNNLPTSSPTPIIVDTKIFQAHSIRGAATSKAFFKGPSVKEVIDHGKWHCASTWQKFYHREIEYSTKKFQDSVLKL